MSKKLEINELTWKVSDDEYYSESATDRTYSYSLISKFHRTGLENIDRLFEPTPKTESLIIGSAVDCLLTDSEEAFNKRFFVGTFPKISDNAQQICDFLLDNELDLDSKYVNEINKAIEDFQYHMNWKPETRMKKLYEEGSIYCSLKKVAKDKNIISTENFELVKKIVEDLRTHENTKEYFAERTPFDDDEIFYQPKFKVQIENLTYKAMFDVLIVNHKDKTIRICDLKTTSKPSWKFNDSYWEWNYFIQARLYKIILEQVLRQNGFVDSIGQLEYNILPVRFIVASKTAGEPMVWEDDTDLDELEERGLKFYFDPTQVARFIEDQIANGYSNPISKRKKVLSIRKSKYSY